MSGRYLSLEGISLIYHSKSGEIKALDDITFDVEREEFVAIVGPSGCGKTTILSILAGLEKPSSGVVSFCGKSLWEQKGITSLMPQRDLLFEWRKIRKNVLLGLEIKGKITAESKQYADALLEKYGLMEFADKRPHELSGGMRQRASLIRTLVTSPEILLLDEPFSALDFQTRLKVCDDVHSIIKGEKKTAILVTHDISEAVSLADKVVLLTRRPARVKEVLRIAFQGVNTPLERRDKEAFSNYFKVIRMGLEEQYDKGT